MKPTRRDIDRASETEAYLYHTMQRDPVSSMRMHPATVARATMAATKIGYSLLQRKVANVYLYRATHVAMDNRTAP